MEYHHYFIVLLVQSIFVITSHGYALELNEYAHCPHTDCNDNGFCVNAQSCRCEVGFYGKDCEKAITHEVPDAVVTFQVILSFGFVCTASLAVLGFVLAVKKIQDSSAPSSRIRIAVFGIISFVAILNFFLIAIDPLGQHDRIPDYIFKILLTIDQPLCLITFIGVLLHWMELVQISKQKIKQENMLKQINANYPGKPITLEDIIESIKFLRKFRIPFIILSIFTLIFGILTTLFVEIHIYPLTFNTMQQVYFVFTWIGVTVGFFLIRKKLVALMPYQVSTQVRKLTARVAFLSIINLLDFILFSLMQMGSTPPSAGGTLAIFVIERFIVILTCILTACVFLHFKKGFPFVTVSASSSFGSSSRASNTKGSSTNLSAELTPIPGEVVEEVGTAA